MKRELKQKIEKANEQIKRLKEWYKERQYCFELMDLKLHDCSFYAYDKIEEEFLLCGENSADYFYDFCQQSYDVFINELTQEGINFNKMVHHLGRTSSFWLHDRNTFQMTGRGYEIDWHDTMCDIGNEADYACIGYLSYDDYGMVIGIDEEYPEESDIELNWLIEDMYTYITNEFEDVVYVGEKIKDFKDNQVEYFMEYLKNEEEYLRLQKEEQELEEKSCKELIDSFGVSEKLRQRLQVLSSSTLKMLKEELNI